MKKEIKRRINQSNKISKNDVSEVYSRPRVSQCAEECGLRPGWALDLKTQDELGNPWDFDEEGQQQKAIRKIEEDRPNLLMLSPMCTAFSILQNLSYDKKNHDEVKALLKRAIKHVAFAVHLCDMQIQAGRYFVFEHPKSAKSWQLACMRGPTSMQGAVRIMWICACSA